MKKEEGREGGMIWEVKLIKQLMYISGKCLCRPVYPSSPHYNCSLSVLHYQVLIIVTVLPNCPPHTHTHVSSRKDIGLEKFFKKSLLNTVKRKNIRPLVVNTFQHYETLTMEGCIFQFFNLLSKSTQVDVERFSNCAVGVSHSLT